MTALEIVLTIAVIIAMICIVVLLIFVKHLLNDDEKDIQLFDDHKETILAAMDDINTLIEKYDNLYKEFMKMSNDYKNALDKCIKLNGEIKRLEDDNQKLKQRVKDGGIVW